MMKDRAKKKITIHDVAREANVSISTVSHVLNGTAKISDATRQRVIEVVQRFNYVPNGYGLRGRDKNSKVVGVMVADIKNEFYARCVQSIMNVALQENYTTMICEMAFNYKKECMGVDALLDKGVDGIIFIGGSMDGNIIRKANKSVPVILCDRKIEMCIRDRDYGDDEFKQMANELIERQLEEIPNDAVREKAKGYIAKIENGERDFRF